MFKRFEEIHAWKKSMDLAVEIYTLFRHCKDYSFKDQIQRASVSVSSNIAEGYERNTNKEFIRFLFIAKGSCGEVRSLILLAHRLTYIGREAYEKNAIEAIHISRMLSKLILTLKPP